MNGGLLIQNCPEHALPYTHSISDGEKIAEITSTHHQMQYPFNLPKDSYKILWKATPKRCYFYDGDLIEESKITSEPEVVIYKQEGKPKCLAIQGHPEIMRKESPIINILNDLIIKYLYED